MSNLAQSLQDAQLAIVISGKKTVTGLNTLNHVIGVLKLPYRNDSTIAEFLLRRY